MINGKTQDEIIISSRIRIARNLKSYPFPNMMSSAEKVKLRELVIDAVVNSNFYFSSQFEVMDIEKISKNLITELVKTHMISPQFTVDTIGKGLILSHDRTISIMINEEDHVRIQVITDGMNLKNAYELADKVDVLLNEKLDVAFNEKLGYLTQCPTNLGTGMRASLMLYLPALNHGNAMNNLVAKLSKLGIAVRGFYGEGTKPYNYMYQISNQISLGISEEAAIENLIGIAKQVVSQEIAMREYVNENYN